MGLFDFLGGKKPAQAAAPAAPLGPWQQALHQAESSRGFAWQDDNAPARAYAHWLLTQAAPAFGNGKVVDGTPPAPGASLGSVLNGRFGGDAVGYKDRNVELHGIYGGLPVRIPISIPARKIWAIEVRCEDTGRYLNVLRDPARIPAVVDANDPWATSEQQCVFIGKGIFLDDGAAFMQPDYVKNWTALPAEAQALLLTEIERLDLRFFALSNTHKVVVALGNPTLHTLEQPIEYMQAVVAFLARFVKLVTAAGSPDLWTAPATAAESVTCAYCRSIFLLLPGKNTCPNCGAPAGH